MKFSKKSRLGHATFSNDKSTGMPNKKGMMKRFRYDNKRGPLNSAGKSTAISWAVWAIQDWTQKLGT